MEKKRLTGKDIMRMDGLLPPTRRIPVRDAVPKKKEKKWSMGELLKRISSMLDYDSSSSDVDISYCKKVSKKKAEISRNTDSADGSIPSLGRRIRRNNVKARVEANRDRLCAGSSSDEESRRSNNSLTRSHNEENGLQNGQKNSSCSRRTRAARTERYIKRLSRDEGNGGGNDEANVRESSSDLREHEDRTLADAEGSFRPPIHPRRSGGQHGNTVHGSVFPDHVSSLECVKDPDLGIPEPSSPSIEDLSGYTPPCRYGTDLNQNKTCMKSSRTSLNKSSQDSLYGNVSHENSSPVAPPAPPPRDTRRAIRYECHSFPFNPKHQRTNFGDPFQDRTAEMARPYWRNLRSYNSSNEIGYCESRNRDEPRRPMSLNSGLTQFSNSHVDIDNNEQCHQCHDNEANRRRRAGEETEASICRRRNTLNDQMTSSVRRQELTQSQLTSTGEEITARERQSYFVSNNSIDQLCSLSRQSSGHRDDTTNASNEVSCVVNRNETTEEINGNDKRTKTPEEEALERKRNSKNLEEALSELEAIYNSLSLGDEDLLDRAERRSMEEFSLRRKGKENQYVMVPDSPDRTTDDMAYRRMHPKERPASLSEIISQSSLPNISYLIASPILSRKEGLEEYAPNPTRPGEPDVMLDDVVFRSINRANNTLKVPDPQPPFGIPIGPVTTATESDYLHTTPKKPEHPRSPYIPQPEPDIVTDDLAYRTLRKDQGSKTPEYNSNVDTVGTRKKRAVRSMSANLYGLINHDKIHLRNQPSETEMINDQVRRTNRIIPEDTSPSNSKSGYLRRVVSDGELSDHEPSWNSGECQKKESDVNGNRPFRAMYQRKLQVYVPPEATVRSQGKNVEGSGSTRASRNSDVMTTFEDEFWHSRSDIFGSATSKKEPAPDINEYSKLCQDLVDLMRIPENGVKKEIESTRSSTSVSPEISIDVKLDGILSSPTETAIDVPLKTTANSSLGFIVDNAESTENDKLDYYLRLTDENVKLIAEAFSSVADHIRDSQDSTKKKCSLAEIPPELKNEVGAQDTTSGSSTIFDEDDSSEALEKVPERNRLSPILVGQPESLLSSKNGDDNGDNHDEGGIDIDLSKAVRDLEFAAASLRENVMKTEELKTRYFKSVSENVHEREMDPDTDIAPCLTSAKEETKSKIEFANTAVDVVKRVNEQGEDIEHMDEEKDTMRIGTTNEQQNSADSTQVSEQLVPDEKETITSARMDSPTLGLDALSSPTNGSNDDVVCEGEIKECELDFKMYGFDFLRSVDMHIPHVTNLMTVTITTYSVVLLAYLLALLLAIITAS